MIIIISISNDGTTNEVINWITHLSDEKILRINLDVDEVKLLKFDDDEKKFIIQVNSIEHNLYECTSYWYRKGGKIIKHIPGQYFGAGHHNISYFLDMGIRVESDVLDSFIYNFLEEKSVFSIGKRSNATPNKLIVLEMAKNIGINIPESFLFTRKKDVLEKIKVKSLITKAASDGIYIFNDDYSYYTYTELMDNKNLKKLPDTFFPSLFQVNINKKFEIRSFFLGDQFFSMAIFSQNSQQTKIDFRKYNQTMPNRKIPYKLPKKMEESLKILMKNLDLNTGSIDLIVDKNDNFYFLEVNPVGQFGMVSNPCNYMLEKKVALSLVNKNFSYEEE